MLKNAFNLTLVAIIAISISGCSVLGTALAAGASYAIYQATRD
ncbi:MAG TPA: hypothetical protein VI749_00695 [Candidatus Omnitrophota bacterium]|nr:hypothetical protein [Candidatus Omnitrophota bacterium]